MSDDPKVGYGNPPKHTLFKKGQSGNLKGRPGGSKNFKTVLREELNAKIDLKIDGKSVRMTKQEAVVKAMVHNAIKGSARHEANLLRSLNEAGLMNYVDQATQSLSPNDAAIVRDAFRRLVRNGTAPQSDVAETEVEVLTQAEWRKRHDLDPEVSGGETKSPPAEVPVEPAAPVAPAAPAQPARTLPPNTFVGKSRLGVYLALVPSRIR